MVGPRKSSRINGIVKHYDIKLLSVTGQPNLPCCVATHADVPSPRKGRVWGGLHDEPKEGMPGRLPRAIISRKQSSFPSQSPLY